ncbi:MAG TPA: O-antigen ligase family protein [Candidatus Aquilonibacter sp.]|jgi:O-antigen ligase|nr:O-antigen ligase family protein [Candidatus Aquilonibacter sp.]
MAAAGITEIHRREFSTKLEKILLYGIFGLLLFGPLAFGAVEPWSILTVELGSIILFLFWIGKQAFDGQMNIRWNPIFLPMGVFGVLIASQLIFRITAYPHDTASLALIYIAYATLCFLAGQTLVRGAQARSLALIFSVYGTAVACFALLQGISPNGKLYWLRQPRMGGWIYGPYVNHNHYAGLMEMLAPIPLVVSLTKLAPPKLRAVAAAAAAIMVGTIFLSGSRGGMLAIVAELVILSALLVKQKRGMRTAIGIGVFLALVGGMLIWIGGSELSQRIASAGPGHSELSSDIRKYINRDGFRMFMKRPILGWGLGTFPIVYPEFRTFYTNFFVNEAHNDYLQLLIEMGLLGFATMLWFVVTLYARAIEKIAKWSTEMSGAMTLACLLGLSGILVHSAVDFNLQIPANAALFYVLCTVAAAEPFAKPARKRRPVRTKPAEEAVDPAEILHQPATNF